MARDSRRIIDDLVFDCPPVQSSAGPWVSCYPNHHPQTQSHHFHHYPSSAE